MTRILASMVWALALVAAASAQTVGIGIGAPLTGPDAPFGDQLRAGVEQAVADMNAAGGLLGHPVEAVPRDDGSDPKKGADVAKAFVAGHVAFVVGHFSSAVTAPASAIYAEAGVLEITPSATAPLVTEGGFSTVFRLCGRDDAQAGVAVDYLLAHHVARIAILHDRTTSGKALADSVRAGLAGAGRKDVLYGSFEKGTRDVSGLVARLKASGAQVAFWGGGGAEAGVLARQLREANAKVTILGGIGMASDEFAAAAGAAAEGALMVFPRDPRPMPAAADLLRRLRADHDTPGSPGAYVFAAYAAVEVLRQAAEAAHTLDAKKIAETMHSGMIFKTVLGDITFDATGDRVPTDLAIYVWHKGASGRMTFDDLAKS